jgi:uncharacterized protein
MKKRRAFLALVLTACIGAVQAQGNVTEQLIKEVDKGDAKSVAALLDKGLDPNTIDQSGSTILMIAAFQGHDAVVKLLLDRNADMTRRAQGGDTALMLACLKGHLGTVKLLVEKGAEVSRPGWAPLHYAAYEGRAPVVRYLLEKGASKDALAPNGYTPLLLAMLGGHMDAARELLYADADVRIKGQRGETALGLAKKANDEKLVELIKRAGAVE